MTAVDVLSELEEKLRKTHKRELPPPYMRKLLRENAHLSQADLAEILRVTSSTFSRWENGKREPRGERAEMYKALLERLSTSEQP